MTSGEYRNSSHLPFWVSGSGYYGQTLGRISKKITDDASELILKHLDTVAVKGDGVFTVADFGTNDGSSSMTLMGKIVGQLRNKHGKELPIQIIYEDQEQNDFNSLFKRLTDGTSYLSEHSNVYPLATNLNFYKQCVPDGTCDVIYTSTATHWLENPSVNFKNGICHSSANADSEELRRFHAEAERDWIKFLLLRAKELKKGGLLITLNITTTDDFQDRNSLMGGGENGCTEKSSIKKQEAANIYLMFDLDAAWRQLQQENIITQEEYERCLVAAVFRKPKEETAPFEAVNSSVVEAGLSLVHYDQVFNETIFRELWREKQRTGGENGQSYYIEIAKAHMVGMRTSFENCLSDSRSAEDKEAILHELYKRFEARVAERDPETFKGDYIISRLVARKI